MRQEALIRYKACKASLGELPSSLSRLFRPSSFWPTYLGTVTFQCNEGHVTLQGRAYRRYNHMARATEDGVNET